MDLKWCLFLPVHRYAYIGMVANAYSGVLHLGGVDYSVYEVWCSVATYGLAILVYETRTWYACMFFGAAAFLWVLVRYIEYYTLMKATHKWACFWALLCFIPVVLFYNAERMCKE